MKKIIIVSTVITSGLFFVFGCQSLGFPSYQDNSNLKPVIHEDMEYITWDAADNAMELGVAVAGLFGGAFGLKVANFFRQSHKKSVALREIIEGNELFKKNNAQAVQAFKDAQGRQSANTKQLVSEIKSS